MLAVALLALAALAAPAGAGATTVTLSKGLAGGSLVVNGGGNADVLAVLRKQGAYVVTDTAGLSAGDNCSRTSPTRVRCASRPGLTSLLVFSGGGNDRVAIDGSVPSSVRTNLNGGSGNDRLTGGRGRDTLDAGGTGADVLAGGPGGDSLQAGAGGADRLAGGRGADILIADGPCRGHRFSGGPGSGDSTSFARSSKGVRATIGGRVSAAGCGRRDRISSSVEILEGSRRSDVLSGDGGANSLLGRGGNDHLFGRAGNDRLIGGQGSDRLVGGPGRDRTFQ